MTKQHSAPLARIGIVTISDRASAGVYQDISGQAIIDTLTDYLTSPWQAEYRLIPDEQSLQYVPTAILSRQTAGLRGSCLIINLPGKPAAIRQCLDAVFPAVPYCIDLMHGPYLTTHPTLMPVFRPAS